MSEKQSPVVFIHGLWLHQSSWQPREDHFSQAGKSTLKQYRHSPAVTDLTKFSDRGTP